VSTKEKIIIAILFIIPILRGLYFYHEAYFYGAVMTGILFFIIINNKKIYLDVSLRGLCLFFVTVLNFISILYAIDYGMAFLESLKWLIILISYLVFIQLNINEMRNNIVKTIFYCGIILSLVGIISMFIPELKQNVYFNNRLGSTIQYPNALGVFLVVALIWGISQEKLRRIDIIGSAIIISGVILTFSRSIYAILIGVLILLMLYEREKTRKIIFIAMLGILVGVILGSLGQVINTIDRVGDMTPNVSEFQSRLAYYEDGIKLIMDKPMGIGGLGYKYSQKSFQTAVYSVKYIHNGFLQIAIDNGIVAAMLVLVMFCDFFISGNNKFHEKLIVLIMVFHSLIDFDFEFPLFFIIIVLIFALGKTKIKEYKAKFSVIVALIVTFIYLYMFTATYFNYSGNYIKATLLYPYYTEARVNTLIEKEDGVKILEQNKYSVRAHQFLVQHYDTNNNIAKKLYHMRQLMDIEHLEIKRVQDYSKALLVEAKRCLANEEYKKSQSYLQEILDLELYIKEQHKTISQRAYKLKHLPVMVMTPDLIEDNEEAKNMRRHLK